MKKLIYLFIALTIHVCANAQITVADNLQIKTSMLFGGTKFTGVSTASNSSRSALKIITEQAIKDYVDAKVAEAAGTTPIVASNTIKQYLNGYLQMVGLVTDSIVEGSTNLFFTPGRVRSSVSANTATFLTYNSSTGQFGIDTTKLHSLNYLYSIFQPIGGAGVPSLNSVTHVDSATSTGLLIQGTLLRAMNSGGVLCWGYKGVVGTDPGDGNTGNNLIAFGPAAAINNSGSGVFVAGYQAGKNNSGYFANGFGTGALFGNSGNAVNAFGSNAGLNNSFNDVNLFGSSATADSAFQAVFSDGAHNARLNFGWLRADRKFTLPDANGRFVLGIGSYLPDRFGIVNLPLFDGSNYYTRFQVDSIASTLSGSGGFPAGIGMNTSDGNMNLGGDLGDNDIDIRSSSTGLGIEINQSTKYLKLGNIHSTQLGIFGDDGYIDASGFNQMLLPSILTSNGINYSMPVTNRSGYMHNDGSGNLDWNDPLPAGGFGLLNKHFDGTLSWDLVVFPAPSNIAKQYINGFNQVVNNNSDSIPEGSTNKYYTDARAKAAITGTNAATVTAGVVNVPYTIDSLRRVGVNIQGKKNGTWITMLTDSVGTGGSGITTAQLTDSLNVLRLALAAARDTLHSRWGVKTDTVGGIVYLEADTNYLATKSYVDISGSSKLDKAGGTVTTFVGFAKQTSDPATPASGFVDLFFDNSSRLSYKNANGYKRTYSMPYPGDQLWAFPYKVTGGTLADSSDMALKLTKNTAITGATKTKITYDANGLVTAGADIAASDLPTGIDAAKLNTGVVSNTELNYLDGVTSSIQTQVDGKLDKSMSAYKFNANNTNTTANATPQNYKDIGWQTYAGTITWTGTTAASGTTNHTYRWHQIGGHVWFEIILDYGTASSACTAVTFDLPSDMPAPFAPTASLTGANIFVGNPKGGMYSTKTVTPSTNIGGLRQNSTATGWEFTYSNSSGSYKMVMVTGDYYIN